MEEKFAEWADVANPDWLTKRIFGAIASRGIGALEFKLKSLEQSESFELCAMLHSLIEFLKREK